MKLCAGCALFVRQNARFRGPYPFKTSDFRFFRGKTRTPFLETTRLLISCRCCYRLQYATNSSFTGAITHSEGNFTTTTVFGLSPNTNYYFRVIAFGSNTYRDSDWSATLNLRERFVEDGLEAALDRKKRLTPPTSPIFDGRAEAHLERLACTSPPEGRRRWTLQLLADKCVELSIVPHTSHETVRSVLKKTNLSLTSRNAG